MSDDKWLDDPLGAAARLVLVVDPRLADVADRMPDHGRQVAPRRDRGVALQDIDRRRSQILTQWVGHNQGDL